MDSTLHEISPSVEKGRLGMMHLKRFWSKLLAKRNRTINQNAYAEEWSVDVTLLSALGVALHPAMEFVCNMQPSFEAFEDWILANGSISDEKIANFNQIVSQQKSQSQRENAEDYPLSDEELNFWEQNGFLIIKNAVPVGDCQAVVEALCDFLNINLADPTTWYVQREKVEGIWVSLYKHPALQKNRDSPKIRSVYEQLWKRTDIWVNTDRVSFNPPETDNYAFPGPWLHWDVSLELPIPFGLQGLLYLSDTAANQGAFTLVPGFHHQISEWLSSLPACADPRKADLYALGAQAIAADAGDFIIWHHALPHGSSPNVSHLPRMVQYINYRPIDFEVRDKWK